MSTNGSINAFSACLDNSNVGFYKSFGELFMSVFGDRFDILDKNYTYMFELVSPYNRIVVPYKSVDIYHIGTRDMNSLEEVNIDIGIKKPIEYDMNNLNDIISAASKLPYDNEGYVVVDKYFKRVKVKSSDYLMVHRTLGSGVSFKKALEIILINEQSEFLSYFPEYREMFDSIERKLEMYKSYLREMQEDCVKWSMECSSKKEFAMKAQDKYSFDLGFIYGFNTGKIKSIQEYLENIGIKGIIERLSIYE